MQPVPVFVDIIKFSDFQKINADVSKTHILSFLTTDHLQAEWGIWQEIFLHVIPFRIIVPCIDQEDVFSVSVETNKPKLV